MSIKASKTIVHVIIDRAFKTELEEFARQDNRSLSNLIDTVLQEYAQKRKERDSAPP